MTNESKLIPSGEALQGAKLFLRINAKSEIGFAKQVIDFGALLLHPTKVGEKTYPLTGWFGPRGNSIPVVAEYTENPEAGQTGHAKPSVRVFNDVGGTLAEIAVAFKRDGREGRHFHSGTTSPDPKFEITLNHKREGEPEHEAEPSAAPAQV